MKLFAKFVLLILVGLLDYIINKFKKTPLEKEEGKHETSINTTIDRINKHDTGYKLPDDAKSDKWGTSVNP